MTCKQARQLMSKYLENGLQENETGAFRAHLAVCPNCCREAEEIGRALDFVRRVEPPAPPANLRQIVLQRIQCEATVNHKRAFAPGFKQGAAAAAVFILLMAGNMLLGVPMPRMNSDAPPVALKRPSVVQEYAVVPEEAPTLENFEIRQEEDSARAAGQAAEPAGGVAIATANDTSLERARADRVPGILRLALNVVLVPLFLAFFWLAVKKRREF